ncbi:hypothetical protein D9C73_011582 [Collichthys lucidus]|uniref:Uncharacterized protein n=1 Tax=Collichthys lucidus TaxID=240159 RepID=A0A4U5USE1_COLLU|nr:hypothetical protein D9C73_011582 [Collichthys lucidus]
MLNEEQSDEEDFQGAGVKSTDKTPEEEEEDYTSSCRESEEEGSASGEDEEDEEEDLGTGEDEEDEEEDEEDEEEDLGTGEDEEDEEEDEEEDLGTGEDEEDEEEDEEDEEEDLGTGEESGELLMSVHCGGGFCDGTKEDRIFAEGQPPAPEAAESSQVKNEEQGDRERDEEVSYFERVPERGSVKMIKDDGIEEDEEENEEEKQEDSSDSECEDMKIEQESEIENPCRDGTTKASLEFPEISVQNLQDLIAEVDSEECAEKMKDFSGEEHQEAGESFADYPSDFSSYEDVEDGGKNKKSDHQSTAKQDAWLERAVTDITWMRRAEETAEEGDEYLYSIDLEVDADKFRGLDVATEEKDREKTEFVKAGLTYAVVTGSDDEEETSESDSYSSDDDDDEVQVKRSVEELVENMCEQDLESNKQLEGLHGGSSAAFAGWSTSDDYDRADFNINWNNLLSEDLLTTEDTDRAETLFSDLTLRPAEAVNTCSMPQRGDATNTSPSNQGSLDDSFFFNIEPEASGSSELEQLGDDEYEDERNWEQEKERIKAFYKFYDDSEGENDREGRQIKVQFCTDPLSQVIHYETDSSDRDSLSSSTDREEDLSSAETSEELKEPEDITQMQPVCEPPCDTQPPENVPDPTQNCTRKHKCLNMLKLTLNMGVVIGMGLVMLWFATDQADWLSQMTFF